MNVSEVYRGVTAKPNPDEAGIKLAEQQKEQAKQDFYNIWLNSKQTQDLLKELDVTIKRLDSIAMQLARTKPQDTLMQSCLQEKFAVSNVITMIKENKAYAS